MVKILTPEGQAPRPEWRGPEDQNQEWRGIYEKLRVRMAGKPYGEHELHNWFARCKFVSRENGLIVLEHWGGFPAKRSLQLYGYDLCLAAGVQRAHMRYPGGVVNYELPQTKTHKTNRMIAEAQRHFRAPAPQKQRCPALPVEDAPAMPVPAPQKRIYPLDVRK